MRGCARRRVRGCVKMCVEDERSIGCIIGDVACADKSCVMWCGCVVVLLN